MKRFFLVFLVYFLLFASNCYKVSAQSEETDSKEIIQQAIALYETKNYNEAFKLLDNLPPVDKSEEIFLLISNIAQENKDDNAAIQSLNKALDKNYSYYKAYYNLGCIFAKKKSYFLAANNFELAIKYNKNFDAAYYNLALCQMKLKNYDTAKKNLIKAIELNPNNKDFYYNLAYCYKSLDKEKQAKKILEKYNSM